MSISIDPAIVFYCLTHSMSQETPVRNEKKPARQLVHYLYTLIIAEFYKHALNHPLKFAAKTY